MKRTLILLLTAAALCASAQKEGYVWYFGDHAGIDFNASPPSALMNGALSTDEGCASISDGAGNLLFYTDGVTVYNKIHAVMANGSGLWGHSSTTQSAIIVRQPGSQDIYYIFTEAQLAGPLAYSKVDLSLAAGMGSVTVKNVQLHNSSTEKIAAARHCNGTDVWVLSHDAGNDVFRAYLLTAAGLNTVAVTSTVGSVYGQATLGQLKVSPKGNKIGVAIFHYNPATAFEVLDFDPSTGIIFNAVPLHTTIVAYGCEFSPDGTKFYGGRYNFGEYFQWDLCAGSPGAIAASKTTFSITGASPSSFQLAPDGNIYIANPSTTFLSAFTNPNAPGNACGLQAIAISLSPKASKLGLPNFINSYFSKPLPLFTHTVECLTAYFSAPPVMSYNQGGCGTAIGLTSHLWIFGDPASGAANTSTIINPSHVFSAPGNYTVKLALNYTCGQDTMVFPVTVVNQPPVVTVSGNFTACSGSTQTYTAGGALTYSWSTNVFTPTIAIFHSGPGTFWVTGADSNNCKTTLPFSVTVAPSPTLQVAGEFNVCAGEVRTFTASGASAYTWNPQGFGPTLTATIQNTTPFSVTGTDSAMCVATKSFIATVKKCTGIAEYGEDPGINAYPNPCTSELRVLCASSGRMDIYNSSGAMVITDRMEAGERTIGTADFSPGIYLMVFSSGDKCYTLRILKE